MNRRTARVSRLRTLQAYVPALTYMIFATAAQAQTATTNAPVQTAADRNEQQDIVVTAQRRAERLENIPASVSVVTQATLQNVGITRFQDLGQSVPGLQIARTGIFAQPSIRGISTLISGGSFENNIAFYMDGFYEANPLATNGDLANLKDVEVLKGPQGTLYGRNATGGAILVNTLAPSADVHGSISAEYGRFNNRAFSGYLTGQIVEGITASVAAYSRRNDGYIRDIAGFDAAKFKSESIRIKMKFDPVDWASITIAYNHLAVNDPRGATYVEYAQLPPGFVGTTARDTSSLTFAPIASTKQDQYRTTGVFKTPIGALTSRTGYSRTNLYNPYDFDGQPADILHFISRTHTRTFQQSLDYNIDVIPRASVLVGGLYYHDKYTNPQADGYSGGVKYTSSYSELTSEAIALYVDGTYTLTDNLFVTAGARYNHETKEVYFITTQGTLTNTLPAPLHTTFHSITPRANIRYEIVPGLSVYASFSQGFKSGTYNPTPGPVSLVLPIKDEKVTAWEAGFKGVRGPWRWETAAYTYDYRGLQISTTQLIAGQLVQVTGNAKKARISGAEAQISFAPSKRWDLGAAIAYNHARYTDVTNAVGTGIDPVTGLNSTSVQDWSGLVMVRAPAWTANTHVGYNFPLLSGTTTLTAALAYSSRFIPNNPSTYVTTTTPPNTDTAQRFWSPGYTLVNLQASWADSDDHFKLSLFVNNVTNDRYLITNSGATFGSYRQFNEPRTYGGRIAYQF